MLLDGSEDGPTKAVPFSIVLTGAIVVIAVSALVVFGSWFFPDRLQTPLVTTITAVGKTPHETLSRLAVIQRRAVKDYATIGVPAAGIVSENLSLEKSGEGDGYIALQDLRIPSAGYAQAARTANRLNRLNDPDVDLPNPAVPFERFIIVICALALLIGGTSLSVPGARSYSFGRGRFTTAPVTIDYETVPRGMDGISFAIQTLLYGVMIAVTLVYLHWLVDGSAWVLLVIEALYAFSLTIWLVKTRPRWPRTDFYRVAYPAYVAALVAVLGFAIWAATQPMI